MTHQARNKGRYVGARWGGSYTVRILGYDCNPGDVCTVMAEQQAVASPQWTPVYDIESAGASTGESTGQEPSNRRAARRGKEA